MSWQPIESAPKDGGVILGYGPEDDRGPAAILTLRWTKNNWEFAHTGQIAFGYTHWMPLPEPPK